MSKDFDPMPDKAVVACEKVCVEDGFVDGCEQAAAWYSKRGDHELASRDGQHGLRAAR